MRASDTTTDRPGGPDSGSCTGTDGGGAHRPAAMDPLPHPEQAVTGWNEHALAGNVHEDAAKARRVQAMFAAIAGRYDLNNRLHAFGQDQRWRRKVVRLAAVKPGDRVLDVACGTGDLTEAFAMREGASSVTGVDFTAEMLDLARFKAARQRRRGGPEPVYMTGDAMALDFPDRSFDIVSIAFGIRNVTDPAVALGEMRRVLAPGGRLVILECSEPRIALLRWASRLYTHHVMPITATLIARDRSGAYRYLPRSVETFLEPAALAAAVRDAGFSDVRQRTMSFGVATITLGAVPAAETLLAARGSG